MFVVFKIFSIQLSHENFFIYIIDTKNILSQHIFDRSILLSYIDSVTFGTFCFIFNQPPQAKNTDIKYLIV